MSDSNELQSPTVWSKFACAVDEVVFESNFAEKESVWQLEIGFTCLRVQSVAHATVAVDIEYFPRIQRAVALFSPSGLMQVYDFGGLRDLASELGPDAIPVDPQTLAASLLERILNPGRA
jgi:hypothetical protein